MNAIKKASFFCLLLILPFLGGCGYRPVDASSGTCKTISVPYVLGDGDGNLTAAIVREISSSLNFEHRNQDGELLLIVEVVNVANENIGFRYEQIHTREFKRSIIPVETRMIATVQVSLIDAATRCAAIPTVRLSASIDFDHEYNATYTDSNVFSLGQLSDADAAFAAASDPLNRLLAKKIIDYISLSTLFQPSGSPLSQ